MSADPGTTQEPQVVPATPQANQSITILSELDSQIAERMKGQPQSLEEIVSRAKVHERQSLSRHRLSLPAFFQALSYDDAPENKGEYVFKWIFKDKRSIDRHLNVLGWNLVNRTYFAQAPRYLFSANGGVEVGDAILGFIPAKQAIEMRLAPGKRSQERLSSQMTQVDKDYVLMTGNPKDEKVYQPKLGTEAEESSEEKVPGVLTEGRDF